MEKQSLNGRWQFREVGNREWQPAQVPGSVQTDLLALEQIPDPFIADNELKVQWVAERDWEYRLLFRLEPELLAEKQIFLVCDGLNTLAEVSLNGQPVGRGQNMFRQYRWEVTSRLAEGENELRLIFGSPVGYIRARQAERPLSSPDQSIPGAPYLRQAPCQFGWDWGPQLPPVGIWQDIRLEGWSVARLEEVRLDQHHTEGGVTVSANLTLERWQAADLRAVLRLTGPDGQHQEVEAKLDEADTAGKLVVDLTDPQIWWPNGLGRQPLYRVDVRLYRDRSLLDHRTYQIGLRTIELRQEPDRFGASFTFVVNGMPIFAKVANWIPADSFPTRISADHLEQLIRSAALANMNMLRVWGGGFYEGDRFYDLCDRYGLLVWQDFIFACSLYPAEEAFVENVRLEAVQNIRRLRHRASLALWCGNNEMEWSWVAWGWDTPENQDLKAAYDRMFHHLLPELCAAEDPDRPYWPSSPSSGTPLQNPQSHERGDDHYWEVWHGRKPFTAYRDQFPRFMSEFGFQSLPPLETIRAYADEADWNLTSYIMEHHQRHPSGNGLIIAQMASMFRMPKDFPSLVYLSMVLQAEGIRYGVEHWRRNMDRVGGTLYWQLNDCWPVASWSSLDYYGRWKALHYGARRFFGPVLLSAEEQGETVKLHLSSDLPEEWSGTVRWSLESLAGERLEAGTKAVTAPALHSREVAALDFSGQITPENRRELVLVYELWQAGERLSLGVVPFGPTKHLELTDPQLGISVIETAENFEIEIRSRRLARFIELTLAGVESTAGADVIFSDNYFDLPADRTAKVTLPLREGWSVERLRESLRVRSLVDSF